MMSSKLRVLMIHGYRQNEILFKKASQQVRRLLDEYFNMEFVFCEAPHSIQPFIESNYVSNENEKGWWFSGLDPTYHDLAKLNQYGLCESFEYINDFLEKNEPFDGLFAFSQGASFASMLANSNDKFKSIKFEFMILVSAFKSERESHNIYFNVSNKIEIPTLHLICSDDEIISSKMTLELADSLFLNTKIHFQKSSHTVIFNDDDAKTKNIYVEFLKEILKNKKPLLNYLNYDF